MRKLKIFYQRSNSYGLSVAHLAETSLVFVSKDGLMFKKIYRQRGQTILISNK